MEVSNNRCLRLPVVSHLAEYDRWCRHDIWAGVASEICRRHCITYRELRRSPRGENIVFFVDDAFIIKIFAPFRDMYKRETLALRLAHQKSRIKTPKLLYNGRVDGWSYLITTQLV